MENIHQIVLTFHEKKKFENVNMVARLKKMRSSNDISLFGYPRYEDGSYT
jgi:hypothetical protein